MKKRFTFVSITKKINIMVLSITLALTLSFVVTATELSQVILDKLVNEQNVNNEEFYARLIGDWFSERKSQMDYYSQLESVKNMDFQASKEYLQEEIEKEKVYSAFFFISTQGEINAISLENKELIGEDFAKQVINNHYTTPSPYVYSIDGERYLVLLHTFLDDKSQQWSFFGSLIKLDKLQERLMQYAAYDEDSFTFIVNDSGDIVLGSKGGNISNFSSQYINVKDIRGLSSSDEKVFSERKGSIDFKEGKDSYRAFYHEISDNNYWNVVTVTSHTAITKPQQMMKTVLGVVGFLLTIIAFILSKWLAKSISSPVIKLNEAVEKAGRGNLSVRAEICGKDEIARTARSFNNMLGTLSNMVYYDTVTQLPNINSFKHSARTEINMRLIDHKKLAVVYLSINKFKRINDSYGYHFGDNILRAVGERIYSNFKFNGMVSRATGDGFLIMLSRVGAQEEILEQVQDIFELFEKPWDIDEREIHLTTSIGISVYPEDGNEVELLIKRAGMAKSKAKENGGSCYHFYSEELDEALVEEISMERLLINALENDEFQLFYQPFIEVSTGKIVGAEALLRWNSKEYGLVTPAKFIPILESNGQIIEVGRWVIKEACRQNLEWQKKGYDPIVIAVNVSVHQFDKENFVDDLKLILEETKIDPQYLQLEITENIAMEGVENKILKLKKIKEMGVKLSIDDFGTGYCSFSYLNNLPIDTLKIDKSFIMGIGENDNSKAIVTTITTIGKNLNLAIVAEGVETEEQYNFLKENCCEKAQGFLFSKPVECSSFEKLLRV